MLQGDLCETKSFGRVCRFLAINKVNISYFRVVQRGNRLARLFLKQSLYRSLGVVIIITMHWAKCSG